MKKMTFARTALAGAVMMGVATAANAVTLEGATMWFSFDETSLDSLWGGFSVAGDKLSFDPTEFTLSSAANGFGLLERQTPTITITAKDGFHLTTIGLNEKGDYLIKAFGTVPLHEVRAQGQFYVDGTPTELDSGLFTTPVAKSTPWDIAVSENLNDVALTNVKLQNLLTADLFAVNNGIDSIGLVFITKKIVEVWAISEATVVPLPPAAWMLGSALVGLVAVGRRKLGV